MAKYNEKNEEIPDQTPVALPVGCEIPESLDSMIARMIHNNNYLRDSNQAETFEEADDFEIDDDEDNLHPCKSDYEFVDMQDEWPIMEELKKDEVSENDKKVPETVPASEETEAQ